MTAHNVAVIDPPWRFQDKLPGPKRGASSHYSTMSDWDIFSYIHDMFMEHVADDALLFMWRVASMPHGPLNIIDRLGFTPKSELVWVKTRKDFEGAKRNLPRIGMGRYVRNSHETCIIASRGKGLQLVQDHATPSVFFSPRTVHSAKPDAFYGIVERLAPTKHKVEFFARKRRDGWTQFGDELGSIG